MKHIATLRLFDRANSPAKVRFQTWEKKHLRECQECRHGLEIFARHSKKGRPASMDPGLMSEEQSETCTQSMPNGMVNSQFGVYKSLCCGYEITLRAGEMFPDCPNHLKLTTIWKPVKF